MTDGDDEPTKGNSEEGRLRQPTDTGRVEAFSDGVFAIVITLLVLDLHVPQHPRGQLLAALAQQWPAYLGYLASYMYVAVIWLNHHQAFKRIDRVDKGLQLANLTVLFTTALIPFPTAVLAQTFIEGIQSVDARTAVALYAGIAAVMCASWLLLYLAVADQRLVEGHPERHAFSRDRGRALIGMAAYTIAGVVGALAVPAIALGIFLLLPLFYAVTSEGLMRPRARRNIVVRG